MIKRNIPNLLTLCNLLCGCIAIVFAFEGNLVWSAYMLGIACVFDFLDGLLARALNVHSEIGKQLDSLADMVSFGVVPGVIMFQMMKFSDSLFPYLASTKWIALMIPIFSAIRLAKFNIDTRQTDKFIGLPTPANAIFISSLVLIWRITHTLYFHPESKTFDIDNSNEDVWIAFIVSNNIFLSAITIIFSFLLILPLPLFALKFKNFSWTDNKVRYIFLALALALLIIFNIVGIPLIIILYIVLSTINNIATRSKIH